MNEQKKLTFKLYLRQDVEVIHKSGGISLANAMYRLNLLPDTGSIINILQTDGLDIMDETDTQKATIKKLKRYLLIEYLIQDFEDDLIIQPLSGDFNFHTVVKAATASIASTFYCRFIDGALYIEDLLSSLRLIVKGKIVSPMLQVIASCAKGKVEKEILSPLEAKLFYVLWECGLLRDTEKSNDLNTSFWDFHDLLFHCKSRIGGSDQPFGATWKVKKHIGPPPVFKESKGRVYDLPIVDLNKMLNQDPSLSSIMLRRHSSRLPSSQPINKEQLSELLYRCFRAEKIDSDSEWEISNRPYPSGGRCYELEAYLLINSCLGLEAGLYRYLPESHQLESVSVFNSDAASLLDEAQAVSQMKSRPQVLLCLSARFLRVMYKYESLGYALILKHVGVLMMSLYLNSEAMKLSACALGSGNSHLFAKLSGCSFLEEGCVGEFIIGG